ncbi:hypothetical protein FACS1894151_03950 [Spirochaetia bacterium]|nr:hypothetical protein FACS1894151_03950 [Spirochaetia bacterium]
MKINFFTAAALLFPAALLIPVFFAGKEEHRGGYRNLLLVVPSEIGGSPRLDIQKIEDLCEDELLLCYEIPEAAKASFSDALSQTEYAVTLVGVNSSYPHIMGLSPAEGSFFSKQAWDEKKRHAVLNEQAAFTIFGSEKITGSRLKTGGETWIVSGVIRDGDDEHCRIYVPSSVRGGEAVSLMALLDPRRGKLESYAKDILKSLGLQENAFTLYNLETQSRLLLERFLAVLEIGLIFIFLYLIPRLGKKCAALISALREDLKTFYVRELLIVRSTTLLKSALLFLALAVSGIAALFLSLKTVSLCLPWQDIPPLSDLNRDVFAWKLGRLLSADRASRILFIASLVLAALRFLLYRKLKRTSTGCKAGIQI